MARGLLGVGVEGEWPLGRVFSTRNRVFYCQAKPTVGQARRRFDTIADTSSRGLPTQESHQPSARASVRPAALALLTACALTPSAAASAAVVRRAAGPRSRTRTGS